MCKNLLNLTNGTFNNNDVTAVVNDGVITLNGTPTSTSFIKITDLNYTFLPDVNYTISFNNTTAISGTDARFRFEKEDGSVLTDFYYNSINSKYTFSFSTEIICK